MRLTRLNDVIDQDKIIQGRWVLSSGHEISYQSENEDQEFRFKASLVAVEPGALVLSYTEKQSGQKVTTRILKLSGIWSADENNRIRFEVERGDSRVDTLTFQGSWEVNRDNEIVYSYRRLDRKAKKFFQELLFKGYWDFTGKNGLAYSLGGDSGQVFFFRGAFQSKSIYAKKGEIRYQLGSGISKTAKKKHIILFGKWKLSRDLALSFEMKYSDNRRKSVVFTGVFSPKNDLEVALSVFSKEGDPAGAEIILSKEIFSGQGQIFTRLQKSIAESLVEAGGRLRW